uniref:Uncharacterized protein n=1 Tax=viral metagenome TaxID=1070528 RepID=A0A6C0DQA7_9ZZZZ
MGNASSTSRIAPRIPAVEVPVYAPPPPPPVAPPPPPVAVASPTPTPPPPPTTVASLRPPYKKLSHDPDKPYNRPGPFRPPVDWPMPRKYPWQNPNTKITLFARNMPVTTNSTNPKIRSMYIDPGVSSATIDVGVKIPLTPTPSCATILANARSSSNINDFLKYYQTNELISNLKNFRVQVTNAKINKNQTYGDIQMLNTSYVSQAPRVIEYIMSEIPRKQIPILELIETCMKESTDVDYSQYVKKKELVDESKERYESSIKQEEHVSYYEGWFPLFRPMKESMLFWIFGGSLIFILLSIFLFLRMGGVEVQVLFPTKEAPMQYTVSSQGTSTGLASYSGPIYAGLLVGGVLSYFAYKRGSFQ